MGTPILLLNAAQYHLYIPSHNIREADCDCDCACQVAPSSNQLSNINKTSLWKYNKQFIVEPINSEYYVIASKSGALVLKKIALHSLQKLDKPYTLQEIAAILHTELSCDNSDGIAHLLAEHGLLLQTQTTVNSTLQFDTLAAWIHLTDRCNLRCAYCYLPHNSEDMTSEIGYKIINSIFDVAHKRSLNRVKLKYAGGEPLLNFPLLENLHQYARVRAREANINLDGIVLSNGTLLTPQIVYNLRNLDLKLMISLDGLGNYHDVQRSYAGGHGSFADVARSVEMAIKHGLHPTISITVSNLSASGLADIVAWVLERQLPFSLNFYRENDFSKMPNELQFNDQQIISGMLSAFQVIETNLPPQRVLGGITDRANLTSAHTHSCGVGQNYLVFTPSGQLTQCHMSMHQPIGNIKIDPLTQIIHNKIGIQNLPASEKEGCQDCKWQHWCAGGCPVTTYRATGRYDVQSPNCNIYKALFPEALRLEGLRLLKYQDNPQIVKAI